MFNTFITSLKYSFAEKGNITLYMLNKVPFLRKAINDKFYKETDVKMVVGTIGFISNCVFSLFVKSVFLLAFVFLPSYFINNWIGKNSIQELGLQTFVFVSCIAGSILNSAVFNEELINYKMIKIMRMDPKKFYIVRIITKVGSDFFGFMIFFIIFKAANPLMLLLELSFFRVIGEYLNLVLYEKYNFIIIKKYIAAILIVIIAIIFGYGLGIIGCVFNFKDLVENLFIIGILFLAAVLSFYKILKYDNYKNVSLELAVRSLGANEEELRKDINFGNVELKKIDKKLLDSSKFNNKTGYEYLNSIFFYRNNKIVRRFTIIKCSLISLVFIVLIIAVRFFLEQDINEIFEDIKNLSPILVFFMYLLSSTERISKSMFYNCDLALLRYGFYRRREDILKNFTSRIKKIMYYNSFHTLTLVIELSLFVVYIGKGTSFMEILPILISIITLSCFFTIYSVFMYYMLQPYTEDLEVKSPTFKFVNLVMYALCYGCSRIKTAPQYFTLGVILLTIILVPIFFMLIYKYSSKTFKLK